MVLASNIPNCLCFIIKEWFFQINPFSLFIFYHSVLQGFELFGLRVQVHSLWVQFTLARKVYDNHHCYYKLQTGNEARVWMASCLDEMVLRIWGFWKRFSWELDLGHWRGSWVFRISTDRDLKHHKMRCALGMVSIVRIVSLSSCRRSEDKLINAFAPELQSQPVLISACVFVFGCKCVCVTIVIDMVIVYNICNCRLASSPAVLLESM